MVNILSGSVSAYRQESANQRFIRIDEVMDLITTPSLGVVYRDVASTGKIVVIGRP